jgi:urease accessory protein
LTLLAAAHTVTAPIPKKESRTMRLRPISPFILLALLLITSSGAQAHPVGVDGAGFEHGLSHPFSGLDHVLAMIAVGIWAAQRGGRALWLLPTTFVAMMAVGGLTGMIGMPLPMVELGVAGSVVALGLMVALTSHLSLPICMGLVGLFAVFHGHVHGTEMPETASGMLYGLGFVVATAVLHGIGLGLGRMMADRRGRFALRLGGAGIATAGILLAAGL